MTAEIAWTSERPLSCRVHAANVLGPRQRRQYLSTSLLVATFPSRDEVRALYCLVRAVKGGVISLYFITGDKEVSEGSRPPPEAGDKG